MGKKLGPPAGVLKTRPPLWIGEKTSPPKNLRPQAVNSKPSLSTWVSWLSPADGCRYLLAIEFLFNISTITQVILCSYLQVLSVLDEALVGEQRSEMTTWTTPWTTSSPTPLLSSHPWYIPEIPWPWLYMRLQQPCPLIPLPRPIPWWNQNTQTTATISPTSVTSVEY